MGRNLLIPIPCVAQWGLKAKLETLTEGETSLKSCSVFELFAFFSLFPLQTLERPHSSPSASSSPPGPVSLQSPRGDGMGT